MFADAKGQERALKEAFEETIALWKELPTGFQSRFLELVITMRYNGKNVQREAAQFLLESLFNKRTEKEYQPLGSEGLTLPSLNVALLPTATEKFFSEWEDLQYDTPAAPVFLGTLMFSLFHVSESKSATFLIDCIGGGGQNKRLSDLRVVLLAKFIQGFVEGAKAHNVLDMLVQRDDFKGLLRHFVLPQLAQTVGKFCSTANIMKAILENSGDANKLPFVKLVNDVQANGDQGRSWKAPSDSEMLAVIEKTWNIDQVNTSVIVINLILAIVKDALPNSERDSHEALAKALLEKYPSSLKKLASENAVLGLHLYFAAPGDEFGPPPSSSDSPCGALEVVLQALSKASIVTKAHVDGWKSYTKANAKSGLPKLNEVSKVMNKL